MSQRRDLNKLVPELQARFVAGELKIKEAHRIGGLPSEQQVKEWVKSTAVNRVNKNDLEAGDGAIRLPREDRADSGNSTTRQNYQSTEDLADSAAAVARDPGLLDPLEEARAVLDTIRGVLGRLGGITAED